MDSPTSADALHGEPERRCWAARIGSDAELRRRIIGPLCAAYPIPL